MANEAFGVSVGAWKREPLTFCYEVLWGSGLLEWGPRPSGVFRKEGDFWNEVQAFGFFGLCVLGPDYQQSLWVFWLTKV